MAAQRKLTDRDQSWTPLITLIQPGHYVILESIDSKGVTVWNANAKGLHKPGTQEYTWEQWRRIWGRVALVINSE